VLNIKDKGRDILLATNFTAEIISAVCHQIKMLM